jgi:dTDP-glucose 4,6-dehydratase
MYLLEGTAKSYVKQSFAIEEVSVLSNSDFIITGGTGFSGRWLYTVLRTLLDSENSPNITVVSRYPEKAWQVFNKPINLNVLDWKNLETHVRGFHHERKIIAFHASVPAASGAVISQNEIQHFRTQTESFALLLGSQTNRPTFVNLSSGGVYLRPDAGSISELNGVLKSSLDNTYDMVKFADEETVRRLTQTGVINGTNPRLFSFTGPGIDVPGRFALGSFVNDALENKAVKITGNENSSRSYMSPIDLGIWLLKAAIYPTIQNVHIGSAHGLRIIEIAQMVSKKFGNGQVEISPNSKSKLESYVPETRLSSNLLQITQTLDFSESLSMWKAQLT